MKMSEVRFSKDGNDHMIEMMHREYHHGICAIVSSEVELQEAIELNDVECFVSSKPEEQYYSIFKTTIKY